ncbi:MAG: hypothetical protein A2V83_10405 [Nitrospirae bacterium RBG_16_64_22]|nr:MAG: hypothetical protein A2V83_10405 [Nitrospirae bacterium RBG_16_64_22]
MPTPSPIGQRRCDSGAIRFQRLAIAASAFAALLFQRIEPIGLILLNSVMGLLFSARGAPFILAHGVLSKLAGRSILHPGVDQRSAYILFAQTPALDRFIYVQFAIVTSTLVLLAPHVPTFVWTFSGFMTLMMALSGTVGFCMGAVFFAAFLGIIRKLGFQAARWT